jgi:pimeloyl-ACP methyl ester carboxylesterase
MRGGLVIGVALLAALAARAEVQDKPAPPPGTRFLDIDGHRVRVQALGLESRRPAEPILVFEAGASNSLDVWSRVMPEAAALAPAIAYDRAGLGQSDWDDQPPTPQRVVARLRQVLERVGASPPYVAVGYSWGAALARYFAADRPGDVKALVFVDPGPIVTDSLDEQLASFEAVGAGRAGYEAYWNAIGALMKKGSPAARAEFQVLRELMDTDVSRRGLKPLPAVPVAVIIAAKPIPLAALQLPFDAPAHFEADVRHRIRQLQEWALRAPHGTITVSNSTTHLVPREEPELIVWAIKRVLSQITR